MKSRKKNTVAVVAGISATHTPARGWVTVLNSLSGSARGGGGVRRGSIVYKAVWVSQLV